MNIFKTLSLLILIIPLQGFSQSLQWFADDIASDVRESGGSPDLYQATNEDLYVSFWDTNTDQLKVVKKESATGEWTASTTNLSISPHGYKSAIIVDDNNVLHIAFLERHPLGYAVLRYATNKSGTWIVDEPIGNEDLGPYGPDFSNPGFIQASLDIELKDNGEPIISVFDGSIQSNATCSFVSGIFYVDYDLQLRIVDKQPTGQWTEQSIEDIPIKRYPQCLPDGDRFGEFCSMEKRSDGTIYLLANSTHNHELLLFHSNGTDYSTWSHQVIDSVDASLPISVRFLDTFEGCQLELTPDGSIFIFTSGSGRYGFDGSTNRYILSFQKFIPDSTNSLTYSTSRRFNFQGSTNYRSKLSFTAKNQDTLYQTYLEVLTSTLWLQYSFNGGLSWQQDSIDRISTNSNFLSAISNDSLRVIAYDQFNNSLLEYSIALDISSIQKRNLTISESRGRFIHSEVYRSQTGDIGAVVYPEDFLGRYYFSTNESGVWQEEIISLGPSVADGVVTRLSGNTYLSVYSVSDSNTTYQAERGQNDWTISPIFNETLRQLQVISDQDSIYVAGISNSDGSVILASRSLTNSNWYFSDIDTLSSPITTISPIRLMGNTLQIAFSNFDDDQIFLASRSSNGVWNYSEVTQPQNYDPVALDLQHFSTGEPVIVFKDSRSDDVLIAEFRNDQYEIGIIPTLPGNLIGAPLKLIIDTEDKPWILYNFPDISDELKLIRRDGAGNWFEVGLTGNINQIAQEFDFYLLEDDFYIFGRKNDPSNKGIGSLFATEGVRTLVGKPIDLLELTVTPNPTSGTIRTSLQMQEGGKAFLHVYNLQGQVVHFQEEFFTAGQQYFESNISHLPSGGYFLSVKSGEVIGHKKLLLIK